jgi:hypothetical protein
MERPLSSANKKINKESAPDEKGNIVNDRGDQPNIHDMLTGTQPPVGSYLPVAPTATCSD